MKTLLVLAGWGQLGLALGSLAIPVVLEWPADLARVKPLTRQVFWTYSAYIWTFNVCFGLLSAFAPELLLEPGALPRLVAGFIAAYWGARVLVQFGFYDRSAAPPGFRYVVAEAAMVLLFVYLTGVYATLAMGGGVGTWMPSFPVT